MRTRHLLTVAFSFVCSGSSSANRTTMSATHVQTYGPPQSSHNTQTVLRELMSRGRQKLERDRCEFSQTHTHTGNRVSFYSTLIQVGNLCVAVDSNYHTSRVTCGSRLFVCVCVCCCCNSQRKLPGHQPTSHSVAHAVCLSVCSRETAIIDLPAPSAPPTFTVNT